MTTRALILTAMLAASSARASVWDSFGFGARATAMGNAQAAAGEDFTAVYYNPGALAGAEEPEVGTGFDLLSPSLTVDRDRAADPKAPTDRLPGTNLGVHLGLVFPLGALIGNRLAIGAGLYVPALEVTRVDGVEPERPHFYRYEALPDKLVLALGLAGDLHERVSVGLGFQFLGDLQGRANVELDLLTQRFVRKTLKVDVGATGALTAGLLVRPLDGLRLAFSFRDELELDYTLAINTVISNTGRLLVDINGVSLYTPQQFTWGVAWDPLPSLTLTTDIIWARWSRAPDPAAHFEVSLDGEPLGFGALEVESAPVRLGAQDTVSPHVGLEWRTTDSLALRAGYAFVPTPLPAQTERNNHIDSDAHQLGLGLAFRVRNPIALKHAPLTIELSGQMTVLEWRRMEKRSDDDPVGDYGAGGTLWRGALTLRHAFY
ncbi:MAG: outer membrane protein transport protein [Myxococcales bacterium]|nr:outer membrane protein transport protein [Myxococcales bacterium]